MFSGNSAQTQLGLLPKHMPWGRVPTWFSRDKRKATFQLGVMSQLARPLAFRRMLLSTSSHAFAACAVSAGPNAAAVPVTRAAFKAARSPLNFHTPGLVWV